jgi:hypothetical protein
MVEHTAKHGSTCWLSDRHEDVDAVVAKLKEHGCEPGRVLPLRGAVNGVPNCLLPQLIEHWQKKGYAYRTGFCPPCCERTGDPERCPFLRSIDLLKEADTVVCTKAMARGPSFFSKMGNPQRGTVVLDEDPIGLLRQPVTIGRGELGVYLRTVHEIIAQFGATDDPAGLDQALRSEALGKFCWQQLQGQQPHGQPQAVEVPAGLRQTKATLKRTRRDRKAGRKSLYRAFHKLMRKDPVGTVRNVCRDLFDLADRAVARTIFVTAEEVVFHVKVTIPKTKRVFVLDATGNADLLRPVVAPRPVEVLCDEPVVPAGRVVQFMDFNGPRSYLNKIPRKLVKIIDGLGDLHPAGTIVLISHQSCVENLAKASRHAKRIRIAHFGALRGRNDLEPGKSNRIACHIVAGSPKTTEEARRQLALAVYGKAILPFADLRTVRRALLGRVPQEWADSEGHRYVWEVRLKGYADPRM